MRNRPSHRRQQQSADFPGARLGSATVILGVAASDAHVVANQLIAFQLRQLGYDVVNLGACTPVAEFVECAVAHPDALAVVIGSHNGHAIEDLMPLQAAKRQGLLACPVIVGGNLSVGSEKSGNEVSALQALGVDYVLHHINQLLALLDDLRAYAGRLRPDGGRAALADAGNAL